MCATSAIGNNAICAPSKAQPPAVAPGFGLAQPDFDFLLWAQAGSSSKAAMSFCFMLEARLKSELNALTAKPVPDHLLAVFIDLFRLLGLS